MGVVTVLAQVAAGVVALHLLGLVAVVGRDGLVGAPARVRANLRSVAPTLGLLAVVLAINGVVRDVGVELSWLIGVNITGAIYALEGGFVAWLQSFAAPPLTTYFSGVYVFGYAFLLTFPVVAYLACEDDRPVRTLLVAYAVNYALGLVCYVLFISYGPRNVTPEAVRSLLYTNWPQAQLLTGRVNRNTNVFPSLHTSLSVTVALVAGRYRDRFPRWYPVAGALAASIAVSTMYLGIHWATDVVAGAALAVVAVAVGALVAETADESRPASGGPPAGWTDRVVAWIRR
ncbi:phosphatase PAP2 family protein [Halosimplex pelagicum]|uniref:Phosphatase PAP2 family protein n=1 Tax=Halosimplex pelagicum TaxID=869886 RepID=A0A7D5T2Y2_9EURY|nr:phosphatase PAP2 family protein [Halosimplex pelagicum]QLH80288.1 phosphatase PAP2 family protein [Halosimplex pelagicum]